MTKYFLYINKIERTKRQINRARDYKTLVREAECYELDAFPVEYSTLEEAQSNFDNRIYKKPYYSNGQYYEVIEFCIIEKAVFEDDEIIDSEFIRFSEGE